MYKKNKKIDTQFMMSQIYLWLEAVVYTPVNQLQGEVITMSG